MSGLRSNSPYIMGLKPKKFFAKRLELLRINQQIKDKRKFNPDWAKKAA